MATAVRSSPATPLGLGLLRPQHLDIGLLGRELGLGAADRRLRPVAIEGRLVEPRLAGEVGLAELYLPLELGGGVGRRRLGPHRARPRPWRRRWRQPRSAGRSGRSVLSCVASLSLRRLQRQPVVAVVEPRDHVAGLDRLVVRDLDRGDIALHLGGEDGDVALDIGIVRADQEAPVGPPVVAEMAAIAGGGQQHGGRAAGCGSAGAGEELGALGRWPAAAPPAGAQPVPVGARPAAAIVVARGSSASSDRAATHPAPSASAPACRPPVDRTVRSYQSSIDGLVLALQDALTERFGQEAMHWRSCMARSATRD